MPAVARALGLKSLGEGTRLQQCLGEGTRLQQSLGEATRLQQSHIVPAVTEQSQCWLRQYQEGTGASIP